MVDDGDAEAMAPFISRVRLKNYKSIAECDVRLKPLTILVGPNGAGKSNFLDALAFLVRAVATSPAEAIEERGGLDEILCRVPNQTESFSIDIEVSVPWWPDRGESNATYRFEIGRNERRRRGFEVVNEDCSIRSPGWTAGSSLTAGFSGGRGEAHFFGKDRAAAEANFEADRLLLPVAGTQGSFAQLYVGLSRPRFYNFAIDVLRRPQRQATGVTLQRSGEGLGDVLSRLSSQRPDVKTRIDAYISAVVHEMSTIKADAVGGYATVALETSINGKQFRFDSVSMSDGTIRAAAVLAALFQPESLDGRLPLIGIEEPEVALHPGAAGVLFDALTEATEHVQVIATSQSADLLDREDLDVSVIRPVALQGGLTVIGEVDDASREIVKEKLFTLGELMRSNQIVPQPPDSTSIEA